MLEIVLLFFVGKNLAALVRRSGREVWPWITMLIVGWIGCEIIASLIVGGAIYFVTGEPPSIYVIAPFALMGGAAFGWLIYRMARNLAPVESAPGPAIPPPLPTKFPLADSEVELPITGYFLAIDGKRSGPFSLYQIRDRYRSGEIVDATLYWLPTEEKWEPVGKIAGHFR